MVIDLFGSGAYALDLVVEENDNGSMTVFVLSSPAITIGNVFIVDCSRVTLLEANMMDFADYISQWGVCSQTILGKQEPETSKS